MTVTKKSIACLLAFGDGQSVKANYCPVVSNTHPNQFGGRIVFLGDGATLINTSVIPLGVAIWDCFAKRCRARVVDSFRQTTRPFGIEFPTGTERFRGRSNDFDPNNPSLLIRLSGQKTLDPIVLESNVTASRHK